MEKRRLKKQESFIERYPKHHSCLQPILLQLFLQVFIRISIQFGGFPEQHQGNSRKNSHGIVQVFAGIFCEFCNLNFCKCRHYKMTNKYSESVSVVRITGIFFEGTIFLVTQTVEKPNKRSFWKTEKKSIPKFFNVIFQGLL